MKQKDLLKTYLRLLIQKIPFVPKGYLKIYTWVYIRDSVASGMTVWVTLDTGLEAGSNVQRVAVAGVKSEGCEGGVRGAALGSLLYTENGSDAGRSRLTFRPLACCSRGAFINSSVLIPRIDEWPPIAIPRARCPHLLPPSSPTPFPYIPRV